MEANRQGQGSVSAAGKPDASTDTSPPSDAGRAPKVPPRRSTPDNVVPPERCDFKPPDVLMLSPAGEQVGGYASSCISCLMPDEGMGTTTCADGPTQITGYSIVHPGDPLTFVMPDGTIMGGGASCKPACPPQIAISNLDCPSAPLVAHEVSEDVPIDIDLPKGRYLITFSSYFEAGPLKGGSMGAGFGLIVDPLAERNVLHDPREPKLEQHCPDSMTDADAG